MTFWRIELFCRVLGVSVDGGFYGVEDGVFGTESGHVDSGFLADDFEVFLRCGCNIGNIWEEDADFAEGLGEEDESFSLGIELTDIFEDATTSLGVDEIDTNLDVFEIFWDFDRFYETRIFETKEGIFDELEEGIGFLEVDSSARGDNFPVLVERDEWDLFGCFVLTPGETELFDGRDTFLTKVGLENLSCDIVHRIVGVRDRLLEIFEFPLGFFDEFFFFCFHLGEDISELVIPSMYVDTRINKFEERTRDSDNEVNDDNNAHERVESRFGWGETQEKYHRDEWGDEKSDEAPIYPEEDISVIGEDFGDERGGENICENMDRENNDDKIRLHRIHIDVEWEYEDEKENRDDCHLDEYRIPWAVLVWCDETVQDECQRGGYRDREKSHECEDVWENTGCLDSAQEKVGKEEDEESSDETRDDTRERWESDREDIDFRRSEELFVCFISDYCVHEKNRWWIKESLRQR